MFASLFQGDHFSIISVHILVMPAMPGMSGNKPDFLKGLEPQKVSEGGTIKLQAELPPDHGCKIKWYDLLIDFVFCRT